MKKFLLAIIVIAMALPALAKEVRTICLTPDPVMHCQSCENKVMDALRFEKGVKDVTTSLTDQTITIKYDADKTTPEALKAALEKGGFKATEKQCNTNAASCSGQGNCQKQQGCNGQGNCQKQQGCNGQGNCQKQQGCNGQGNCQKQQGCSGQGNCQKQQGCNGEGNCQKQQGCNGEDNCQKQQGCNGQGNCQNGQSCNGEGGCCNK